MFRRLPPFMELLVLITGLLLVAAIASQPMIDFIDAIAVYSNGDSQMTVKEAWRIATERPLPPASERPELPIVDNDGNRLFRK